MTYPGYNELVQYLRGNEKPSFSKFISDNIDVLPVWSMEPNTNTASALFCVWFERFKQCYGTNNKDSKNLKKPRYNYLLWNSIIERSARRKKLKSTYHESALELLVEAESSATEEARSLINSNHGSAFPSMNDNSHSSPAIKEDDITADTLFPFVVKKLQNKLSNSDIHLLEAIEVTENTIIARLKKHLVSLLVKNSLTPIEIETMKQVASNVINFVDAVIYGEMKAILSDEQAKELEECSGLDDTYHIWFGSSHSQII